MGILKGFTLLAIAITWTVKPVNAQVRNPCPQMKNHEVSFSNANLTVYESPNINSPKIIEILASEKFTLFDLSAQYYDGICWYQIYTFSINERGWIGLQLSDQYQANNQDSNLSQTQKNTDFTVEPEPRDSSSLPSSNDFRGWVQIFLDDVSKDLHAPREDIILWILTFSLLVILLTVLIVKVTQKILYSFTLSKRGRHNLSSVNVDVVKQLEKNFKNSPDLTSHENNQNLATTSHDASQNDAIDTISVEEMGLREISADLADNSFDLNSDNLNQDNSSGVILPSIVDDKTNKISIIDIEKIVLNFNLNNRDFFDNPQSYFHYLKPTDNVIHGLAGNLGITNEAELEVTEMSQASYLSFEAEGKWWLIPNLKLSRWQRLLKNSPFFDVLGESSKPMLVHPAQLEFVAGDLRKLVAKGIFKFFN